MRHLAIMASLLAITCQASAPVTTPPSAQKEDAFTPSVFPVCSMGARGYWALAGFHGEDFLVLVTVPDHAKITQVRCVARWDDYIQIVPRETSVRREEKDMEEEQQEEEYSFALWTR